MSLIREKMTARCITGGDTIGEGEILDFIETMTIDEREAYMYVLREFATRKDNAMLDSVIEWIKEQRKAGNNKNLIIESADYVRNWLAARA